MSAPRNKLRKESMRPPGVVNFVMKKNFSGLQIDAETTIAESHRRLNSCNPPQQLTHRLPRFDSRGLRAHLVRRLPALQA